MFETPATPAPEPAPQTEAPKKNKTLLIVGIVLIVLCCCCVVAGGALWYLWTYGDALLGLGAVSNLL